MLDFGTQGQCIYTNPSPSPSTGRSSGGKILWVFPALPCVNLGKLLQMKTRQSGVQGTQWFFPDLGSEVL